MDSCQTSLGNYLSGYVEDKSSHFARVYFEEMYKKGTHNLPSPSECGALYCDGIDIYYSTSPEIPTARLVFRFYDTSTGSGVLGEMTLTYDIAETRLNAFVHALMPGGVVYWRCSF